MNTFEWCGYNWKSEMEGGRTIHPDLQWCWYSMNQISIVDDNCIELNILYNPKDIKYWDGKIYHSLYECALMRSVEKFGFGIFSCTIKVPEGVNLFPSFWTSGDGNWPPELDIMEGWSNNNCWFEMFTSTFPYINPSWSTTTNVHYRNECMQHEHIKSKNISVLKQPLNPAYNFIKYECEWLPNKITFKANGAVVRTVEGHVCEKVTKNILKPEEGYEMNVIFNVFTGDPSKGTPKMKTPMIIKDFKYEKYDVH